MLPGSVWEIGFVPATGLEDWWTWPRSEILSFLLSCALTWQWIRTVRPWKPYLVLKTSCDMFCHAFVCCRVCTFPSQNWLAWRHLQLNPESNRWWNWGFWSFFPWFHGSNRWWNWGFWSFFPWFHGFWLTIYRKLVMGISMVSGDFGWRFSQENQSIDALPAALRNGCFAGDLGPSTIVGPGT